MLSTSTDGLLPAKKFMMIAFRFPVRIGFVPHTGPTAPAMTPRQVTRFACPARVLCWLDIGGPRSTNSKCMAIYKLTAHVNALHALIPILPLWPRGDNPDRISSGAG